MFVFQTMPAFVKPPAQSAKELAQMESQFLKITEISKESLGQFHEQLVKFSAFNIDSKSQAFVHNMAIWGAAAAKGMMDDELAGKFFQLSVSSLQQGEGFEAHSKHYEHLIDVTNNWRAFSSGPLPLEPIDKLVNILDKAWKNQNERTMTFTQVSLDKNSFVFASKAQAEEFVSSVLSGLPADFSPKVKTAAEVFGSGYTKNLVKDAHVVEFTCTYKDGTPVNAGAENYYLKPIASTSKSVPLEISDKLMNVVVNLKGDVGTTYKTSDIREYAAKNEMDLSAIGQGTATVDGIVGLHYAGKASSATKRSDVTIRVGHMVDPVKNQPLVNDLVKSALQQIMVKYGISNDKSLEEFLIKDGKLTEEGARFIDDFNKDAPTIKGSSSMEVFYDGTNYSDIVAAINYNEGFSNDRTKLVENAFTYLNNLLSQCTYKGETKQFVVKTTQLSIYFFQDLEPIMDKLIGDKNISENMRTWLRDNRNNLNGERHMESLLDYLGNSKKEGASDALAKLSDALEKKDFSLMNTYWKRSSKNKQGLRVENDEGKPSALAEAIEDGGDGSSRSISISVSVTADLAIEMKKANSDHIKVQNGKKADVEVSISTKSSFESMSKCIRAYVVDKSGASAPVEMKEKEDEKDTWVASGLAPGEYAIVAYAQSENSEIVTPLVGQNITVKEIKLTKNTVQTDGSNVPGRKNEYNTIPFYAVNNVTIPGKEPYREKVDARVAFAALDNVGNGLGFLSPGINNVEKEICYSAGGKEIAIVRDIVLDEVAYSKKDLLALLNNKAVGIMVGDRVFALDGTTMLDMQDSWSIKEGVVYDSTVMPSTKKVVVHKGLVSGQEFGKPNDEFVIPYYSVLPTKDVEFGEGNEKLSPRQIGRLAKQGYIALIRMVGEDAEVFDLNGKQLGKYARADEPIPSVKGIYCYVPKEMQSSTKNLPSDTPDENKPYWFDYPQKVYGPLDTTYIHGIIRPMSQFNEKEIE